MEPGKRDRLLIRIDERTQNINTHIADIKQDNINQWKVIQEINKEGITTKSSVKTISKLIWCAIVGIISLAIPVVAKFLTK